MSDMLLGTEVAEAQDAGYAEGVRVILDVLATRPTGTPLLGTHRDDVMIDVAASSAARTVWLDAAEEDEVYGLAGGGPLAARTAYRCAVRRGLVDASRVVQEMCGQAFSLQFVAASNAVAPLISDIIRRVERLLPKRPTVAAQ